MNVRKSITINRPRGDVYAFWRDFENLPRLMGHLESVENLGADRSHWRVRSLAGEEVEWDAEIVEARRNERISWRTIGAADDVRHAGTVLFRAINDSDTEVEIELTYDAPGGRIGATFARLYGHEPGQQVEKDLEHLKQILERAEIVRPMGVPVLEGSGVDRKVQVRPVDPVSRAFWPYHGA